MLATVEGDSLTFGVICYYIGDNISICSDVNLFQDYILPGLVSHLLSLKSCGYHVTSKVMWLSCGL